MATIMFVPVPEFGHMIPPLKLAKALVRRGHRVYYIGFLDFEEYIESQGMMFVPMFASRYPKGYLSSTTQKRATLHQDVLSFMLSQAQTANDSIAANPLEAFENEILSVVDAMSPNLLVVDNMLRDLAGVMANVHKVPTIRLSLHFEEAKINLTPDGRSTGYDGLPVIVLCPKELDFTRSPPREHHYYLEASVDCERTDDVGFPWERLDRMRPMVYCSFGSQGHQYSQSLSMYRLMLDTMRSKRDWQMVLSVGPCGEIGQCGPVPENVLVLNWAPQIMLLKRASLMVSHGGLGAIKECILLGVPMLVFPGGWDQPHHAARLAHHGIGIRASGMDLHPGRVSHLMDTMLNSPVFRRRLDEMRRRFQTIESSGIGVRTVEALLAMTKANVDA
jgi:zeaxanthin glucosyltransferase